MIEHQLIRYVNRSMTACTRTRTIKPTFSFGASQLTASFRMQDSSTIIKAYPSNSIKNSINDLHTEEKSSLGGSTNEPRDHLQTLEDGK